MQDSPSLFTKKERSSKQQREKENKEHLMMNHKSFDPQLNMGSLLKEKGPLTAIENLPNETSIKMPVKLHQA